MKGKTIGSFNQRGSIPSGVKIDPNARDLTSMKSTAYSFHGARPPLEVISHGPLIDRTPALPPMSTAQMLETLQNFQHLHDSKGVHSEHCRCLKIAAALTDEKEMTPQMNLQLRYLQQLYNQELQRLKNQEAATPKGKK